jgi:hypothetical protein
MAALLMSPLATAANLAELFDAMPPRTLNLARAGMEGERIVAPEVLGAQARLAAARQALVADPDIEPGVQAPKGAVDEALAAYEAHRASTQGQPVSEVLGARSNWLGTRFSGLIERTAVRAEDDHLREQELMAYGLLFKDWKKSRLPLLWLGQARLEAVGPLTTVSDARQREALTAYAHALLDESAALLTLSRTAIEHANGASLDPSLPDAGPAPRTLWDLIQIPG